MKISVVIPTFNEEQCIGQTVRSCIPFAHEVIVVDGGSSDLTWERAESNGARIIHQPQRGYGLAFATGFMEAKGDFIATLDGDGTYPAECVVPFAEALDRDGLDFISGCRFPLCHGSSMKLVNELGNQFLSGVASVLWNHEFHDILSGFWIFRRELLGRMRLYSRGWNLSQEIKIEALKRGRFQERHIPYLERMGHSKLSPLRVGTENLTFFLAHRFGLRQLFRFHPYEF